MSASEGSKQPATSAATPVATPAPAPGDRPPRTIVPGVFFEQWLPAAYAAWRGGQARRRPTEQLEVRVRLDGEGGGAWDLLVGESQGEHFS